MATAAEVIAEMEIAVGKTEGGQASAAVLINEFAKFVAANKTDPAVLQAFVDRLNAGHAGLDAAVVANPDPDPTD